MIVIADSNLIFSSLYNPDGTIASILKNKKGRIQFIAPDVILEELREHLPEIVEYTGKTKRQIIQELRALLAEIAFYEVTKIPHKHIDKASEVVKGIDFDDVFFVALHFYQKHKLWTGDTKLIKGLKKKGYDICITTAELKKSLYEK